MDGEHQARSTSLERPPNPDSEETKTGAGAAATAEAACAMSGRREPQFGGAVGRLCVAHIAFGPRDDLFREDAVSLARFRPALTALPARFA
jgi:hypothetical protein